MKQPVLTHQFYEIMKHTCEPIISVGLLGATPDGWTVNPDGTTTIPEVKIGIGFHWERTEQQTFAGELTAESDGLVINKIPVEEYLRSVISSEMSANAPIEFLKAHAIVSRSWLLAVLQRRSTGSHEVKDQTREGFKRVLRWYDRDAHDRFDVCADDHCQRYQGISRISNPAVDQAIAETRGMVLTYEGEVCDARFSKSCGGQTESYSTAWEEKEVPYLQPIADDDENGKCYCNCFNRTFLRSVLNSYDIERPDFQSWTETLTQRELKSLLWRKASINLGDIKELTPYKFSESGRIVELLIEGTKGVIVIGKELEIRRILSESHVKSSKFAVVRKFGNNQEIPEAFTLIGVGWGHGVGMIGAAVMASRGMSCEEILHHYFTNVEITKLYE